MAHERQHTKDKAGETQDGKHTQVQKIMEVRQWTSKENTHEATAYNRRDARVEKNSNNSVAIEDKAQGGKNTL